MQIKRPAEPQVPQHLKVRKRRSQETEKEWPLGVLEAKGRVCGGRITAGLRL